MYLPENNDSQFTPPPSGNHIAICTRFIDLGTQPTEWQGQKKLVHKVLIGWELPTELMEDGRPFTISKRYTWSMSEKATLRGDLESWRGRKFGDDDFTGPNRFNTKNIIGKPCFLNVVHAEKNGKVYANISAVTAMPKGVTAPDQMNKSAYLALERDSFDGAIYEGLSEHLRKVIAQSPEFQRLMSGNAEPTPDPNDYGASPDDEIPF
jgi:hypothetical protein